MLLVLAKEVCSATDKSVLSSFFHKCKLRVNCKIEFLIVTEVNPSDMKRLFLSTSYCIADLKALLARGSVWVLAETKKNSSCVNSFFSALPGTSSKFRASENCSFSPGARSHPKRTQPKKIYCVKFLTFLRSIRHTIAESTGSTDHYCKCILCVEKCTFLFKKSLAFLKLS